MPQVPAVSALAIDRERLRQDILELAEIGKNPEDRGLYRMAFTPADMEGKAWLRRRLEAAGLPHSMDGAGNVWSRIEGREPGPSLLIGSHLDTVPCAGALDGSLGVLIGLECLRVIRESGRQPRHSIELVAFSDEEGRFGGMLGSQAVCGQVHPEVLHLKDLDGVTLESALKEAGLEPVGILDAQRPAEAFRAYLELHIEQGPVLHARGLPVGVVDEITGLFKWSVVLRGEANHAGTTPMEMRKDAFMGLADFAHEMSRVLEEYGTERSRATVGKAQILPGAANTVAGWVEFSLDVRDTSPEVLSSLADAFRRVLSAIARRRDLRFDFEVLSEIQPVRCDPHLVTLLEASARRLGMDYLKMPSGAAHDAQIMALNTPVGMVFVPSRDGISHSPAEWTAWNDLYAGAALLLDAALNLAGIPENDT